MENSAAAKFDNIGDKYVGRITSIDQRQQTDIDGKAKFFASGTPMMLYVITIQPDGAGTEPVALWAKGGRYTPVKGSGESMMSAIGTAAKAAGAGSVDVGGLLGVAFTGEAEKTNPLFSAPKLYTAQYQPPAPQTASVPVDLFST
jgi:hypothetical protein